jgi:hypothetical protein
MSVRFNSRLIGILMGIALDDDYLTNDQNILGPLTAITKELTYFEFMTTFLQFMLFYA